jgi:hypothetical protein
MSFQPAPRAFDAALLGGDHVDRPAGAEVRERDPMARLLPVPVGAAGALVPVDCRTRRGWVALLRRRIRTLARSAGFAPLATLLERYPKIALGFSLPVLILSLIGLARGDLLAPVLGFYALGVGLIFANTGAHELARDRGRRPTDRSMEE